MRQTRQKFVRKSLVIAGPTVGYGYGMDDVLRFLPDLKFYGLFKRHFSYFIYK